MAIVHENCDRRRICPGMYFADAAIFIGCAMSVAVFDVSKSVDPASGEVITPEYQPLPGTVRYCQTIHHY